jgi:NADPH2:quinone reductase
VGPDGRVVLFGWSSGAPTEITAGDVLRLGITVSGAVGPRMLRRPGGLRPLEERALAQAAAGSFRPVVGQTFALADAAGAHAALERRDTVGKTVLRPSGRSEDQPFLGRSL